ncbi:MAG: hypothetical protein IPG17_16245 [Sandaracinaceae bacterium]|jgi:cell division protein FtsB|nr:hypothetical protein [Sandaracinaceae bacterium]MBP7681549.1 hypothetical protein [Deltaproteobacteria bacterium]MBK6811508.1 hypothetical protein [Sandaracinaceae bacterium]MBK7152444.1 hypothetical protein [Sandaracinaceae bacterium]MBK7773668.1 hypothetical protein [Sandaracinaceae bacterium]
MTGAASETALDELTPDVFLCVGCGAQVSFEDVGDGSGSGTLLDRATCPYCEVVNDRALALLRKQQARERHEARLREERRKQVRLFAAVAALALLVLLGMAGANTHAELRDLHAQVERARAQVENVRERQVAVVARLASAEASAGREAELSGAENRVRIERARYDEAAAAYNAAAGSAWAGLCVTASGLPERAALSNEAHW